jgi:hypothetical protein
MVIYSPRELLHLPLHGPIAIGVRELNLKGENPASHLCLPKDLGTRYADIAVPAIEVKSVDRQFNAGDF